MIDILVVADRPIDDPYVRDLSAHLKVSVIQITETDVLPNCAVGILADVDLTNAATVQALRRLMFPKPTAALMCLVDRGSRSQTVQAQSLGFTDLFRRPLESFRIPLVLARRVGRTLPSPDGEFDPLAPPRGDEPGAQAASPTRIACVDNLSAATATLNDGFAGLRNSTGFNVASFERAATRMVSDLDGIGLDDWLTEVRRHHQSTYQHCLTVAGLAVAFGRSIGLGTVGTRRLALAGLVHDIGKARISVLILDKPGKLTPAEFSIMKQHPDRGFEYLLEHSGLDEQILRMVRHHHEFLDGTGYPDGQSGAKIEDLTRVVTICDIFSALIEERSYKLPMPVAAAYGVLVGMAEEGRLDGTLVSAFKDVAYSIRSDREALPIDHRSLVAGQRGQ